MADGRTDSPRVRVAGHTCRLERRRYPRLETAARVRRVIPGEKARRVVNISIGGLRVFSDDEHRPGDHLELELILPDGESLEVVGQVVWIVKTPPDAPASFDVGIEYFDLAPGDREKIASVLAAEAKRATAG
jgi:hypothetical protein